MRFFYCFVFLFMMGVARADQNCEMDLNGDGVCDEYSVKSSGLDDTYSEITISVGGSDQKRKGSFELGDGGMSSGYIPGDFSLLIDFHTRNTELTKYNFRWDLNLQDWVLYKMSTWVEPDRDEKYSLGGERIKNEEKFPRQFDVQRIECCTRFTQFSGNSPVIKNFDVGNKLAAIQKDFDYVVKNLPQGERGPLFFKTGKNGEKEKIGIPKDFVYEMTLILNNDNVGAMNDYAYYLYRNKDFLLAAFLLKEIHQKYPERVVATLNLADAYWDIGMKKDSCPLYKNYVDRMNLLGRSARIPASVKSKVDCT